MTALIILIVLAGLLWLIGQGIVLALLWGQQQRLQSRLGHFAGVAGMADDHPPGHSFYLGRLARPTAEMATGEDTLPRIPDVNAPDIVETDRASTTFPEELTFPPPIRLQSPVPSAREPHVAPDAPSNVKRDHPRTKPDKAPHVPHDKEVRGGATFRESERAERTAGLPSGSLLPDFELPTLDGEKFRRSLLTGKRTVLLFLAVDCPGSNAVLASIRSSQVRKRSLPDLVLVLDGGAPPEAIRTWLGRLPKRVTVVLQEESELASVLRVSGTPAAYVLEDAHRTRGGLRSGARAVLEAIGVATAQMTATARRSTGVTPHASVPHGSFHGLAVGERAPDLSLPLLGGGLWKSASSRWKLLIFWDSSCPPCDAMADALIEAAPTWTGFDKVVISRGPAPNGGSDLGNQSDLPIVVQQGFNIARQFRLLEAPAAIALTPEGDVARPPAIGAAAVLTLAQELNERTNRLSLSGGELPAE